ncbi:DNA repair protein RecO [Bacillus sp. FJAT-44742]|uniref:DNA repair protein RecO n=1 Tax=Bacillus sp. FJAT-44742 TaxID=2014005 RepID=UPI000C234636|nr:DNA repair protein RecO [Bacillus sp. FJAT-44742]
MLDKAEGIVLRTISYGESNVIVTLFTREAGKIAVMAKGAKKPKSRLASITQPFMYGMFLYYKGSGMSTLSQGDPVNSFKLVRADINKTAYASYFVEMVDKLTEEKERNPYLFELLLQLLQYLNEEMDEEVLMRIFETKMTAVAGIKPELDHCASCQSKEGEFSFSVKEAGFLCRQCVHIDEKKIPISQQTVRLLRLFFYMDIARLGTVSLKQETKDQLKTVLETYYDEYSGLHLKSKRFLNQLEKWKL